MARKAKQQRIEGTENNKRIPALSKLAVKYQDAKLERCEIQRTELALKNELDTMMRHHQLTFYEDPDEELEVTIENTSKVKVRRRETQPAND